ncbi:MAG: hypothetical protein HQ534_03065 [Armatimonadetes bacterium]|nr:hypothetical protein [Armatimonadota bacterium]
MPVDSSFEKQWLNKLQNGLQKLGKADLFNEITKEKNTTLSSNGQIIL